MTDADSLASVLSARWRASDVDPRALTEARLWLHWASQLASACGATFAPPRDDFSHTSLSWVPDVGGLACQPVGDKGTRAALRLAEGTLVVLDKEAGPSAAIPLAGLTLAQGMEALGDSLAGVDRALGAPLRRPEHDLPPYPVADGERFPPLDGDAAGALAGHFENAAVALEAIAAASAEASPVRCWPHHFDIATLLTLDPGADAETARSTGLGLSPGDGSYDEPYYYVTPWPYPEARSLPGLPVGHWHEQGFTAAVLTASELGGGAEAPSRVAHFLVAARAACQAVLGP